MMDSDEREVYLTRWFPRENLRVFEVFRHIITDNAEISIGEIEEYIKLQNSTDI